MTKQFWVNNYFIDVTRNQIQHQQQATLIPPKALKVLEVLASRAGEVVSHDELMDIVWENSVVGPNTLQRAIAQLRKAFGDDSKKQAFIKTHAKQGYSLEANVRWENNTLDTASSEKVEQPKTLVLSLVIAAAGIAVLIGWLLWPSAPKPYNKITPLTASDEQEYNAAYSPDGSYLVFNRYVGQCESHLWAKDLNNNQEQRLSTEPGHYSQLNWSADGSQLAFVMQSDCSDKPNETHRCWQLQTLDFAEAWNGNAKNLLRYDCAGIESTHPNWLNDGRIAMLQYSQPESVQPQIVIYDAVANALTRLPNDHKGRIYSMDYSRELNLLATVTLAEGNTHVLRTLSLDGVVDSEAIITPLPNQSVYAQFPIEFAPDGSHFLTDVEGKIYALSLDGDMALMHTPSQSGLWNPSYHPSKDKIAVTYGKKDFDIGFLDVTTAQADIDTFSRSTAADVNAKFQPNGELIAFVSQRSGVSQLWIIDGDRSYQLTQFEYGLRSSRFSWSPDGQTLAANVGNQVALVQLDGSYRIIESTVAVDMLMPWTRNDRLLVTDNQTDEHQLYSIDINTGGAQKTNAQNVMWAVFTQDNSLIYADHQLNFWLRKNTSTTPLTVLNKKIFGNYLLFKDAHLYGVSAQAQLWDYNVESGVFQIIAGLDKDVVYISDIRDEAILATKFIGGRRELVEISQE